MRLSIAIVIAALAMPGAEAAARPAASQGLTVFAAASLTDAFKDIGSLWLAQGHKPVTFSFASSSTLATQIQHGAPADIFASADELWMDKLDHAHRIAPGTRSDLVGNTLVLVERKAGLKPVSIGPGTDLAAILGKDGRLAVGDPAHVPAGIYAAQSLRKLGLWGALSGRLAPADSVRGALMLVAAGEAPAGIVYGTDVAVVRSLGVAGTFPADSHDPIRYPVAAIATHGGNREVRDFLAFLHSQPAQDVFAHYGFPPP